MRYIYIILTLTIWSNGLSQSLCDRSGISNGWMLHLDDTEVDQITAECAASGALYFRADFAWSDVQYDGSTSWNWENVDRVVNSATDEGLSLIAIVDYFPPWADVDTDTIFWRDFVYQAGLRYIPLGVNVWEMWNEPNITNFWPNPDVEDYVDKILIPGSNAIRQAALELDMPVIVLTGGLAPAASDGTNISQLDFVNGIYNHGGADYFDALGQHPYCWPLDPAIPDTYNWFLNTDELRDVMITNGDESKQIWGTEMGWPTSSLGSNGVSEVTQALYLESAYSLWNDWDWTGPLIWYAYNDAGEDFNDPEDNFGLVDFDFVPKPSLDSFININTLCEPNTASNVDITIENNGITLFPNPVVDVFSISGLTHASTIQIVDPSGAVYQDYSNSSSVIEIDITSLPTGVYFVTIEREGFAKICLKQILKD